MPDYSDHNLTPVDRLHHVEGLVSLSDRVARRKEEQQRRRERKGRQQDDERDASDAESPSGEVQAPRPEGDDDEHIDFRA